MAELIKAAEFRHLLPLPPGETLIGVLGLDREGNVSILIDRGFTHTLNELGVHDMVDAFKDYLESELRLNRGN